MKSPASGSHLKPSQFLANMRSGKVENLYVIGNHATPRHVDFVCTMGLFESIWFDLEHFDIPVQSLAVLNMVARSYPVTTIARFKAGNYQDVMRVLETGVGAIMCAMVESGEEARKIVQWAKFNNPSPSPGEVTGLRGWNGGGVDARYGTIAAADYVRHQNTETAVICQIETQEAVDRLEEIVSVPGVDGIFFGPGDFAHRIGKLGQISHPDIFSAIELLAKACRKHGKYWGTVAVDRASYAKVKSLGAQFICPGGDVRVMINGIRSLAATFAEP